MHAREQTPQFESLDTAQFGEVVEASTFDGVKRCVITELMKGESVGTSVILNEGQKDESLGMAGSTPYSSVAGRPGELWPEERVVKAIAQHYGRDADDPQFRKVLDGIQRQKPVD